VTLRVGSRVLHALLVLLVWTGLAHAQGGGTLGPQGRYYYSQGGDRAVKVTDGGTDARTAAAARYNLNVPCRHCADSLAANWKMTGSVVLPLTFWRDTSGFFTDDADTTKKAKLQLSGLTTATTRFFTLPDRSGEFALLNGPQTFSGITTFSDNVIIDQQADRDGLAIHFRSSLATTSRPLRVIDDDASVPEFYVDPGTGYMTGGGFALGESGGSSGDKLVQQSAALTTDRLITWANLAGTPQLLSGTQSSSATMTWSGTQTFSNATKPLFKSGISIEDPGAGTNTVGLVAPSALGASYTWTLPTTNTSGYVQNNAGTLSCVTLSGISIYGEATVDFGDGAETATVTVSTATVVTASVIVASMALKSSGGRDVDELDMDQFAVVAGNIVNGVSFDIQVTSLHGNAHGTYLVHYYYSPT